MPWIIITGGGRRAGKTTVARAIAQVLGDSIILKLGRHPEKREKTIRVLPTDTPFAELHLAAGDHRFIIVESGSILDDPQCPADLVIYLPRLDGGTDKPGANRRKLRAHIVRGEPVSEELRAELATRLDLSPETVAKLCATIEAPGSAQV